MKMSCDRCSVHFTLFKRKKYCQECHRYFCSTCLPKPPSSSKVGRQCSKCRLLMSGYFSRDDLQTWKINDMRCFLNARNISTKDCREKHDLIELVLARFCKRPRQSVQDQVEHEIMVQQMTAHVRDVSFINESSGTSGDNSPASLRAPLPQQHSQASMFSAADQPLSPPHQSAQSDSHASGFSDVGLGNRATNQTQEEPQEIHLERLIDILESMERIQSLINQQEERSEDSPVVEQPNRRTHLDDIAEISDIDDLTVRQLKELLVNNFVDYKGCCEKVELVQKTKNLWKDHQENKLRAQRILKQEEAEYLMNQNKKNEPEESDAVETITGESTTVAATTVAEVSEVAEVEEDDEEHQFVASSGNTKNIETSKPSLVAEITSSSTSSLGEQSSQRNDSLCHICMDSLVDCILLECGHMVTCTQCGKRLADCPVCRQYISRVVRVFRS